ncbi:TPA: RHS repeat protein [Citrobacter freundii]|nr:hypothetical protein CFA70_23720 [Citrobacter freundii]POV63544.1 RHS repeat protein [Citrobacter freundii complex sp. CFNIH11]EJD6093273.1 RHS repeat protein [Citrobacter freundii]EKS9220068.1 RHS repeat protein [Citrobacter freundii]EKU3700353.1 RHS repeat protein [Citrobacter freundii]
MEFQLCDSGSHTTQTDAQCIWTIYTPGSFTPLVRIETQTAELAKAVRRTLAEQFQQDANVTFPPELVTMLDTLEAELKRGAISEQNQQWLKMCGLSVEQMRNQVEPELAPVRKIHLYHCDLRRLPLALVDINGDIAWNAEFDEWGNVLRENNPNNLQQLTRLPGLQWDKETGLYYNRHRYLDPLQGRYITQDPIGLKGGWNLYSYPLNPVENIDPLGLATLLNPFFPPLPWPKSPEQQEADANAAKALTKWWNDRVAQTETLEVNIIVLALFMCASRSARWTCSSSCNVTVIDKSLDGKVPLRATGSGKGSSQAEACENAKRDATQSAPRGTYTRHCQCRCAKG